jgi:phage N-6-adenine-methyltransferase
MAQVEPLEMVEKTLSPVVFSRKSDEWETPDALFELLSAEFHFTLDAAATRANRKCSLYLGPDHEHPALRDALTVAWTGAGSGAVWLNPPYSRVAEFVAKAAAEQQHGVTSVLLLPARTDTRWFHAHLYQKPGVEVRFLKGRLRFKGGANSAPFPSMVVVLWGKRGVR